MSIIEFKKNDTVLSFKQNNKEVPLRLNELKKNLLILGATGTGKTTTVIKPCIEKLIESGSFGLIFDLKGNLYADVKYLAKKYGREKDIMFVGTYDFCENINLLKDIKNESELKTTLERMIGSYHKEKNEIWRSLGIGDIVNVFCIYNAYKRILKINEELKLNDLIEIISNKQIIKEIYSSVKDNLEYLTVKELMVYNETISNHFSLFNTLNSNDISAKEQESWRSGTIRQIFADKSDNVINKLYSGGDFNLKNLLINKNKIIVLCAKPEEYYKIINEASYIRKLYMEAVTSLNKYERKELKIGEEFNRYSFLLIDEYQGFVNFEKNSDINDELWLSISREYENINIFSTQSISSILSQSDNHYSGKSLLQNFVNKIIFSNLDNETIKEHFIYAENGLFIKKMSRGECLVQLSEKGNVVDYGKIKMNSNNFNEKEYELLIEEEIKEINKIKKEHKIEKIGRYITKKYLNKIEFDNSIIINKESLLKTEEYKKIYKELKSFNLYDQEFIDNFILEKENIDFKNIDNEIIQISNIVKSFKETLNYKYVDLRKKEYTISNSNYLSDCNYYFVNNSTDIINNNINMKEIDNIVKSYDYVFLFENDSYIFTAKIKKLYFIFEISNLKINDILNLIKIKKENKLKINIDFYSEEKIYNKFSLICVDNRSKSINEDLDKLINREYSFVPYNYFDKVLKDKNIRKNIKEKFKDINKKVITLDIINCMSKSNFFKKLIQEIELSEYIKETENKNNELLTTQNNKEENILENKLNSEDDLIIDDNINFD